MSRVLDSSFLIAFFDEDDPRHEEAFEEGHDPSPLLVPPEVLTETIGVMHSRFGYETAQIIGDGIGKLPQAVHLNSTWVEEIEAIYEEGEGRLSWTDAAVVAHCLREDAEPLCYDPGIQEAYEARAG